MRVRVFIVLAIILAAGLAIWSDNLGPPKTEPLKPAPIFTVQNLLGAGHHPSTEFKGKTVLLNFWASWCIPCRVEMPALIRLAAANPTNLELILLSEDEYPETAAAFVGEFSDEHDLPTDLPNVMLAWDSQQHIAVDLFDVSAYPETAIIAPDGTMLYKIIGALTEPDIRALTQYLGQKTQ